MTAPRHGRQDGDSLDEDHPEKRTHAEASDASEEASVESVEAVVRRQLAQALGGRRGMIEAAVPTILFTALWLTTKELQVALVVSVVAAVALQIGRAHV